MIGDGSAGCISDRRLPQSVGVMNVAVIVLVRRGPTRNSKKADLLICKHRLSCIFLPVPLGFWNKPPCTSSGAVSSGLTIIQSRCRLCWKLARAPPLAHRLGGVFHGLWQIHDLCQRSDPFSRIRHGSEACSSSNLPDL